MFTCPILAFTPEVKSALRWFDSTHELVETMNGPRYERLCFAGPGHLGDQDYRLLTALDYLRFIHNELVTKPKGKSNG